LGIMIMYNNIIVKVIIETGNKEIWTTPPSQKVLVAVSFLGFILSFSI